MQSVVVSGRDPVTHEPSVMEVSNGRALSPWSVRFVDEETPNSSSKQIVVTAGMMWQLLALRVELTTDATVGDRQLVVQVLDRVGDVEWEVRVGLVQAASLTYYYNFGPSMGDLTAVRDTDWVCTPIPPGLILPGSSRVHIYDNNAVSVGGDDMIVHMLIGQCVE